MGIVGIQEEIKRLQTVEATLLGVDPEKITSELAVIGFASMGDYIRIVDGLPVLDLTDVDPSMMRAIAQVRQDRNGVSIKLHDKQAALVTLAKTLGMIDKAGGINVQINAHDGAKMAVLSTEDLRKALDGGVFDVGERGAIAAEGEATEAVSQDVPATEGE
jgi:hypothetical protein